MNPPGEGDQPSFELLPLTGSGQLTISQQPVSGGQTTILQQPLSGGQPTISNQPVSGGQPITSQQPVSDAQPTISQQPVSGGQPTISQQPVSNGQLTDNAIGWISLPITTPSDCPPGLECLAAVDQLIVHQIVGLLEALSGVKTEHGYIVRNRLGQNMFFVVEKFKSCTMHCCGPTRPLETEVLDSYKNEVIHLERLLACDSCCFLDDLQTLEVYAPPGCLVGTVQQEWSAMTPIFSVRNSTEDTVLLLEGLSFTWSFDGDVEFKVLNADGSVVGKISKWSGLDKEVLTDADNFGISFPMDLDVRMKAVMLGACILINAMYFQGSGNTFTG